MISFTLGLINITLAWIIILSVQWQLDVPMQYRLYTSGIAMVAVMGWTWWDLKEDICELHIPEVRIEPCPIVEKETTNANPPSE